MGVGILGSSQEEANNQKPLVWWKRQCALLFGIINIKFKTGCPRQKEPVRAHSWWAGSPAYQTDSNRGPAASAQGREPLTSSKPRGQQVGAQAKKQKWDWIRGQTGNPFTAGQGGLP